MQHHPYLLAFLLVMLLDMPGVLRGDVFILREGGKIEGEFLNPNETPRETYRIKTDRGMEITIDKKFIGPRRKTEEQEALTEYNAFAPFREDTIENHLEIAQWCSDQKLRKLSQRHLLQVLELDPDHAKARQLLRYERASDGSWTSREETLASRGFIRTAAGNRTQQQIDVEQIFQRRKEKELAWERKITALCNALPGDPKAREEILAISDPTAVPALAAALPKSGSEVTRGLIIRTFSNIASRDAVMEIARWSLNTKEIEEVRRTCMDEIKKHPSALPLLTGFYIGQLHPDRPVTTINAAAFALAELDIKTAVPDLVKVLVTHHSETRTVQAGGPSFDRSGNAGLGWGQRQETRHWDSANQGVLSALIRLTGQNFHFDQNAWMNWLLKARQTKSFNGRRG